MTASSAVPTTTILAVVQTSNHPRAKRARSDLRWIERQIKKGAPPK